MSDESAEESFGSALRRLRERAGLSLSGLAGLIHYSRGHISRVENGTKRPSEEFARLCDEAVRAGGLLLRLAAASRPRPTAAGSVPRQLPPDVAQFTGRSAHMERLVAGLTARQGAAGPPLALVDGMGGVGKSVLAVHVAHLVADDFPDGQLYIDLRGSTPGLPPRDSTAVLVTLIGALGEVPPASEDAADYVGAYRCATADRRVLLVLDNAVDADQVRPLLPSGSGCSALVTSRVPLAGLDGGTRLHLESFTPAEAEEFLDSRLGDDRVAREPAAAHEVAVACGCLPLALRICAARLTRHPRWPLSAMADRLRRSRRLLDELSVTELELRSCFEISYRALGHGGAVEAEAARMFRLLGLLETTDITTAVAAALLDVSEPRAERILERLTDVQLLDTAAPGHYRLHDLLRMFAREHAREEETADRCRQALDRVLGSYLASARQADLPTVLLRRSVTALLAAEHARADRYIHDPYASLLAGEEGALSASHRQLGYVLLYLRFGDHAVRRGVTAGIRQVVVFTASLDTRPYRLPLPPEVRWYEVDLPDIHAFKRQVMDREGIRSPLVPRAVEWNPGEDWGQALRGAGFDPAQPAVWLVEGKLSFMTIGHAREMIEELTELSAPGSLLSLNWVHPELYRDPKDAPLLAQLAERGTPRLSGCADPARWLASYGWNARAYGTDDLRAGACPWLGPVPERVLAEAEHGWFVHASLDVAPAPRA
ncbi:SAM-dependent methyltransferase [Kitasatospora brasiliensis]|uniref:SAM-dependent methyltransferase n=1 Tax=Kitasatospora brasiliensis TaxID=3058040 RepID=UPI00292E2871|nr:SAM-dependent methyltransferase [Kitasatospora sp. K002]